MAENNSLTGFSINPEQLANLPINFTIKYADVNVNRAIQIEPDQETVILLNLTKNIVTPVK